MTTTQTERITTTNAAVFILGVMCKEVIEFVRNGGLSVEYPLSKSLFFMFLCFLALALMTVPQWKRILEGMSKLEALEDVISKIKPKLGL